ncbi:unnamed protein product [Darwinula stevensoni]|uniref:Wolframin n=1 Tax=Darwinula stevensoni TaxID=69355 RepID=A0A7R9A0K6_9CRUS|nr:unnamed protein product [Darwinula stevensoni]CAG0885754.1 unnamed protein product [Darwinula stevensoni]
MDMLPRKCKPIEENEDSLKSQTLQSGRKQWTLQSGPKSSLRRLRSRLAEDGCPESQVILAKQILQEDHENDEFIMDARDSAEVAIYWLLKAANQGNEEAFSLLEECMKTKSGISHHNYIDVKTCLQQSPEERAAFRAAVDIFQSLCRGEDFITSKQLEKRMQEVLQGKGDCLMSASHETLEELYGGEKLTKEHLIQAAASYTRGEMPVLANILKGAQTKSVGSHMYYLMIDSLAWHGWQFVLWFLPINRLQVTVLFLLYYILSTDILAYYLPCVMLYVSLLAAMYLTSEDVIIQACAAFVILIGLFLLLYCGHRDRWNLRRLDLIVKGLCAVSLCLVFFPALRRLSSITTTKSDPLPLLSWNTYNQLCLPRGVFTRAQLQSSCRFLEGALVEWEGTVKDVSLVESPSFINKMLSVLPASLQESIECMLGTPIENNPHTFAHLDCGTEVLNLRKLNVYRNQRCIYRGWDRPEFLITMSMSSGFWNIGSELLLQADHVFQNFTAALCPGDKIFFSATLHSNLGNSRPELIVKGLKWCFSIFFLKENPCSIGVLKPRRARQKEYELV